MRTRNLQAAETVTGRRRPLIFQTSDRLQQPLGGRPLERGLSISWGGSGRAESSRSILQSSAQGAQQRPWGRHPQIESERNSSPKGRSRRLINPGFPPLGLFMWWARYLWLDAPASAFAPSGRRRKVASINLDRTWPLFGNRLDVAIPPSDLSFQRSCPYSSTVYSLSQPHRPYPVVPRRNASS